MGNGANDQTTMVERLKAVVKRELLEWARSDAGFTLEQAAKRIAVRPERLAEWEAGTRWPTITQLRKIAEVYHRPLAVFFLDVPPKAFSAMHDFRRLAGVGPEPESPKLNLQVRRAYQRREVALDLFRELGEPFPALPFTLKLSDDPEDAGARIREALRLPLETQFAWKDDREAFNAWRAALEESGVLVFQAIRVEVREMRGFSISETPLPAIVVNRKDAQRGRIFTLLHEYTHILLGLGGLCDLGEVGLGTPEDERIEVFCNRVAAAALLPREALLRMDVVRTQPTGTMTWSDEALQEIATQFNVSVEAVLRRLLTLGRTSTKFYQQRREALLKAYATAMKKRRGFVPPGQEPLSTGGRLFVRLVLQGYYQEKITSSDLSDFLSVRLNHLPKIEQAVGVTASDAAFI